MLTSVPWRKPLHIHRLQLTTNRMNSMFVQGRLPLRGIMGWLACKREEHALKPELTPYAINASFTALDRSHSFRPRVVVSPPAYSNRSLSSRSLFLRLTLLLGIDPRQSTRCKKDYLTIGVKLPSLLPSHCLGKLFRSSQKEGSSRSPRRLIGQKPPVTRRGPVTSLLLVWALRYGLRENLPFVVRPIFKFQPMGVQAPNHRPECPSILRPYSHSEERPSGRGQSAGCFLATPPCL
ncbi:hypothetical protein Q3G72_002531 [Acer saccharum]|nr:hypothetical protein Q3G72_002531 [Acer saccharum]